MTDEVHVDITSLEQLRVSLVETLRMLDRLCSENDSMISETTRKINLLEDEYAAKAKLASNQLQQVIAALRQAVENEEVSPSYHNDIIKCLNEYEFGQMRQTIVTLEQINQLYNYSYDYYNQEITKWLVQYDKYRQNCIEIKEIGTEFESNVVGYNRKMTEYLESYSTVIKKGNVFLDKYSEFVRISRAALDDK